MQFTDDVRHNIRGFDFIKNKRPNCICINDRLGYQYDNPQYAYHVTYHTTLYHIILPYAPSYQLCNMI
jgi:hypothetical protein